jgi:hypothetical protein
VTYLLRRLDKKTRWNKEETTKNFSWLLSGEIPADPLRDLETDKCILSFWVIDDKLSNLERVLAAIAGSRTHLDIFDFGLIEFDLVLKSDFNIDEIPGETADAEANSWHRDISHLSAQKLVKLAELLWYNMITERRSKKQVLEFMVTNISDGHLDRSKIKTTSSDLDERISNL